MAREAGKEKCGRKWPEKQEPWALSFPEAIKLARRRPLEAPGTEK